MWNAIERISKRVEMDVPAGSLRLFFNNPPLDFQGGGPRGNFLTHYLSWKSIIIVAVESRNRRILVLSRDRFATK